MGASDFVAGPHYTYDDVPPGQTDFALRHFSIAHDRAEILPLLRQATGQVAHPTIRNRGTTVGSIVHAVKSIPMPTTSEGSIPDADSICAGHVVLFANRRFDVGMPPVWNRDPDSGVVGRTVRVDANTSA